MAAPLGSECERGYLISSGEETVKFRMPWLSSSCILSQKVEERKDNAQVDKTSLTKLPAFRMQCTMKIDWK